MPLERQPPPVPSPPSVATLPLGYVRPTLDDIRDVLTYLSRQGLTPVLSAGRALASEVEDLKGARRDELANVLITVEERTLGVRLARSHAVVEYAADDARAAAAAEGVVGLLRARRIPMPWVWIVGVGGFALGALAFVFVAFAILFLSRGGGAISITNLGLIWPVPLAGAVIGWMNVWARRSSGGSRILLYFRSERREVTLTRVNAWALGITTALISAGGGYVLGLVAPIAMGDPSPTSTP